MRTMTLVAIFVVPVFFHPALSGRLERAVVTPPMVFFAVLTAGADLS